MAGTYSILLQLPHQSNKFVMLLRSTNKNGPKELLQWHNRLGHPFFALLKKMFHRLFLSSYHYLVNLRSIVASFTLLAIEEVHLLLILCILMYGVLLLLSLFSFHYFVTFVDDYRRTTWVYLLNAKSDFFILLSHSYGFHTIRCQSLNFSFG